MTELHDDRELHLAQALVDSRHIVAEVLLGLALDLYPNGFLLSFDQLLQRQALGPRFRSDLVDGAEQLVDRGSLAQRMLLRRFQALLDVLAPLHGQRRVGEVLVGGQVGVDLGQHAQGGGFELGQVAGLDHASDLDVQGRQVLRRAADGFGLGASTSKASRSAANCSQPANRASARPATARYSMWTKLVRVPSEQTKITRCAPLTSNCCSNCQ